MSRILRLVLTVTTALCAWLWVGVAEASELEAPRCDGRGATTFAAPPTMQPLMRSLQVLGTEEECTPEEHADVCGQHRAPAPPPDQLQGDPILPAAPAAVAVPAPLASGTLGPAPVQLVAASAHTDSLERPPR
ncbi:MAG: hypothetical protein EOP08_00510 [Proteobacteria bacterium]|nr:MAG: hypothetical protein EOP08_00510 [Pseudomonadota bacterium]